MRKRYAIGLLLGAVVASTSARAQVAPLRVVSIGGVSPHHALTPQGVEVLRVRVQNTAASPSRPTQVRCELGRLALSGPVPSLPARSDVWITLGLPRARRAEVPSGGTFATCNVDTPGAHANTTMVYTGPALMPNLRFESSGLVVRDCESSDAPMPGRSVCAYYGVQNEVQTLGPIADVSVVIRCTIDATQRDESHTLRELGGAGVGRVVDLGVLAPGAHRLECRADAAGSLRESDEEDNVERASFRIDPPPIRRHDVALRSMAAHYAPWRGHEYPQPDRVRLDVELENAGDAPIVAARVECTVDGAPVQLGFARRLPGSLEPGERLTTSAAVRTLARGEAPPSHLDVQCRAEIVRPGGRVDANRGNDTMRQRLTVER